MDWDEVSTSRDDVRRNKKTYVQGYDDPVPGTMPEVAGLIITPGATEQRVTGNHFLLGDVVVPGFNMPAANIIAKGKSVTIYGRTINGAYEGFYTGPDDIFNKGSWGPGFTHALLDGTQSGEIIIPPADISYIGLTVKGNLYGKTRIDIEGGNFKALSSFITFHDANNKIYGVYSDINSNAYLGMDIPEIVKQAGNREFIFKIYFSDANSAKNALRKIYLE